jgi:hypothetical protein
MPFNIDDGLPGGREDWPAGVLDHLKLFSQGDIIPNPPMFYFADPERPVWARTAAYTSDTTRPELVEAGPQTAPLYGLITSQTCDIAEEESDRPKRPWLQVSPIYDRSDLNSGQKKLLRAFKGELYLLHVPALEGGFWVADLRIEMPLEKGCLASCSPIPGFLDEATQREVGRRIAVLRSRPAFGQEFVDAVQRPLVDALKELKASYGARFALLAEQVDEVAVQLDSHVHPTQVKITLLVEKDLDASIRVWWDDWWTQAVISARSRGLTLHALDVRNLHEVTVAEYRRMVTLPLTRFSPD